MKGNGTRLAGNANDLEISSSPVPCSAQPSQGLSWPGKAGTCSSTRTLPGSAKHCTESLFVTECCWGSGGRLLHANICYLVQFTPSAWVVRRGEGTQIEL